MGVVKSGKADVRLQRLRVGAAIICLLGLLLFAAFKSKSAETSTPRFRTPHTSGRPVQGSDREYHRTGPDYLAFCLFIKNQHEDVREWVGHHLAVGASTIYLFDHRSKPPLDTVLSDHIATGAVQYHFWNRSWDNYEYGKPPDYYNNPQMDVYGRCLHEFGPRHQFMGYLDSDEFLIIKDGSLSAPNFLRRMMKRRPIGGLAVHWRVFGSSGHITRPKGGVLQAYTACAPKEGWNNRFVKLLVNTDYAVRPNRHNFNMNQSMTAVNEDFEPVQGSKSWPVRQDKISVHHYMIKSREEFEQKRERGGGSGQPRSRLFAKRLDKNMTDVCKDATRLGPYM